MYSDKCLVKDIEYNYMGGYRVGWYDEGIKYPYNMRPFYNDGIWYPVDFKYFNPWAPVINPQFALSLPQFRYSAVDIQNPPCIITYLRTYIKYPQAEYLVKARLGKYVGSTMILKKIGSDKGFRKWLMAHREELRAHHYYVDVVLRGYRTGKPLETLQSYREAKINLRNNTTLICIIARSPADLIREGELLDHCVGRMNYDQRFIREESLIFFVRTKKQPNTPLVTLEYSLSDHKVLQCYGEHDHKPGDDILHYVNKVWLPYANKIIKKLAA